MQSQIANNQREGKWAWRGGRGESTRMQQHETNLWGGRRAVPQTGKNMIDAATGQPIAYDCEAQSRRRRRRPEEGERNQSQQVLRARTILHASARYNAGSLPPQRPRQTVELVALLRRDDCLRAKESLAEHEGAVTGRTVAAACGRRPAPRAANHRLQHRRRRGAFAGPG